ncbi:hypothetical protein AB0P13_03260 [Rhodococcus pyridinivorans]|uniref:hypothetical protein n=1 Tax=Rhodococcus pyridinivorans TaxID=103816 RepID=UPI0034331534
MNHIAESHFGRTTRRVVLPRRAADRQMSSSGVVTDCRPLPERPDVRLLVYHDDADDSDYDAVTIGKTDGENDIPVLTASEECLLVTATRPGSGPAIVLAAPPGEDEGRRVREITRQLLGGGPLLRLIVYTGALSVLVPLHSPAPTGR